LREIRIGLLTLAALVALAAAVFLIGDRDKVFTFKNHYIVHFDQVGGLAEGSPVQLNGVNVGSVEAVVLPERIEEEELTVRLSVDRHYAARIREDSYARIKTLGLLGDKYIEVTSGSAAASLIPDGGEIEAAPATDVDKLIASGGDVVENVVAISGSLRRILADMEAGKGILGELTTDSEAGRRAKESMLSILESVQKIIDKVESGQGTLAALINKDDLAVHAHQTLERIEELLADIDEGDGALPALLHDSETRDRMKRTVEHLETASGDLSEFATRLKSSDGLLDKLLSDKEYSKQVASDLERLMHNLKVISDRLEQGQGTLGQIINDPTVYEAMNDILVGVNESRLLRWLIRNRQKKGIQERYEREQEAAPPDGGGGAGGRP
jgi:phospholipid/cholesterol/gamma-HCH transport system substrate-binding protein